MRRILSILVSTLMPVAMTLLLAPDADASDEPFIGRCHMGGCSWHWIRKQELIKKQGKDAALYRLEVLGGMSGHGEASEYPNKYDPSVSIEWEASPSTVTVFCYSRLPVVFFNEEPFVLRLNQPAGATESAHNFYVHVCHGAEPHEWFSKDWLKKHGYGAPLREAVTIDAPGDLFKYVYDADALKWHLRLAARGNVEAQHNLGVMFSTGEGAPKDYAEAVKWFRLAAEQGLPNAQYALGLKFARGEGVLQDYVQAHMWLNLAGSRFPPSDSELSETVIETRDITASKMTPAQLAEAQKLAREWKPK